jgi:hypothetical protein
MNSFWTSSEVDTDYNSSPLISFLYAGADNGPSASASDTSAFTFSSGQRSFARQESLDPEDERFLFKYLDNTLNAAHHISSESRAEKTMLMSEAPMALMRQTEEAGVPSSNHLNNMVYPGLPKCGRTRRRDNFPTVSLVFR